MRRLATSFLIATSLYAQAVSDQLPLDNVVRVNEFYRLVSQIQDHIWTNWSRAPGALLLVTPTREFLTHHPAPPPSFQQGANGFYVRPRVFATNLLATFPAFGPPSVIVIGEPQNTNSRTSTPWLITLIHEHFHQLQNDQPGYQLAVEKLGLSAGDTTGMWMLNYPFPYEDPTVSQAFAKLRDLLLSAASEPDKNRFEALAKQYTEKRKLIFAQLSPNDRKYFEFQLWQEGIARYTEVKAAEAAATYQPTAEYTRLPDYTPFSDYGATARRATLDELKRVDLTKSKRVVVYSFGAAEGFLLDRLRQDWTSDYFKRPFSLASFFD